MNSIPGVFSASRLNRNSKMARSVDEIHDYFASQKRACLRRGRHPEENISRARTVVSPRFLYFNIISHGEKILSDVNVVV